MKPIAFYFLIFSSLLVLASCEKEEISNSGEDFMEVTELQYLAHTVDDAENEELDAFFLTQELEARSRCAEIVSEKPKGEYPNKITLTFNDCKGPEGHTRNGQIIIEVSGPLHEIGSVRKTGFVDFFIDDVQVLGEKTLTTIAVDGEGNLTLQKVAKLEFIDEGEIKRSWMADHTLTQTDGADTKSRFDNGWEITGSATVLSQSKGELKVTIIEPLVKDAYCPWIVSGIKEIALNNEIYSVNYGNGECDRQATVTLPDGSTKDILLGRRR